jgi:hypothetical protein
MTTGRDFRGDTNMPLPLGFADGDIGMKKFLNISFFCTFVKEKTKIFLDDVKY